jgi:hypothetical protein
MSQVPIPRNRPKIIYTPDMMFRAVNQIIITLYWLGPTRVQRLQDLIDNEMGEMSLADQIEVIYRIERNYNSLTDRQKRHRSDLWELWTSQTPVIKRPVEQPRQPVALQRPSALPTPTRREKSPLENILSTLRLDPEFTYVNQQIQRLILTSPDYMHPLQAQWNAMTKAEKIMTAINNSLDTISGSPRELRYRDSIKEQVRDILNLSFIRRNRIRYIPEVPIPGIFKDLAQCMYYNPE